EQLYNEFSAHLSARLKEKFSSSIPNQVKGDQEIVIIKPEGANVSDANLAVTANWQDQKSQTVVIKVGLLDQDSDTTWLWPCAAKDRCQYTGNLQDLVNTVADDLSSKKTSTCQAP